jgi:hypothetical protein
MKNPLSTYLDGLSGLSVGRVFFLTFQRQIVRDYIVELQRKQLGRGEGSDGKHFREYADASLEMFGKPTNSKYFDPSGGDSIRLYADGDFYKSIFVRAHDEAILFIAGRTKFVGDEGENVDLEEYVGPTILGLNEKSLIKLRVFLIPITREIILNEIRP